MRCFYDTCALLNLQDDAFREPFYISSGTLYELEQIKISSHKDESVKYKARHLIHLLVDHEDMYECHSHSFELAPERMHMDPYIVESALFFATERGEDILFVTDDLACRLLARNRGLRTAFSWEVASKGDHYTGFKVLDVSNEEDMAAFYQDLSVNTADCLLNEYVLLSNGPEYIDCYRWNGYEYVGLYNRKIDSTQFGLLKSKDWYQSMAVDSIMQNDVTAIGGPAGSGKSLLALSCAFNLLEKRKYQRIVVMSNPTKARGASDMGYYPGTATEKLLANSVGRMLTTKIGAIIEVERLIEDGKLDLVSMGDVRGFEVREGEILYITECQNTSTDLMKLCLSRVAEGAKVIIEGDSMTQVDSPMFSGSGNGMRKAVEALKDNSLFGYVELQNVWRGRLAELVEQM